MKNDNISFGDIFKAYSKDILNYSASLLKNKEDAKDAVQEVFVRFINSKDTFNSKCSYKTWLLVITRNYCFNILRKNKNSEILSETTEQNNHYPIETIITLREAIKKLSKEDYELVYLKDYAGYSYNEISEILSVNANTLKTKIFGIRRQLQKYME
jgi:RNA polymerase sigma-70 factor, ECF subfamily